jgi:hypothetical protein
VGEEEQAKEQAKIAASRFVHANTREHYFEWD